MRRPLLPLSLVEKGFRRHADKPAAMPACHAVRMDFAAAGNGLGSRIIPDIGSTFERS